MYQLIQSIFPNIYTILQPLHIAAKLGHIRLVKLIVDFTRSTILMLDVDGQTTLHTAVKQSYPKVTKILLEAADPKGLQMENGVGNTILDMVSLGELGFRIQRFWQHQGNSMELAKDVDAFERYPEVYTRKLEQELPKMDAIIDTLFADGRLKRQTKLATELTKFSSMMKERLSAAEAARLTRVQVPKEEVSENKNPQDTLDIEETFSIIVAALKDLTVKRQLVHLIDVQKSVGADLEKAGKAGNRDRVNWRKKDEDGLEVEQDKDEQEKRQSMVWPCIRAVVNRSRWG